MESLQVRIARSHGVHMLQHRMEIYGICAACRSEQKTYMPLTMAKTGDRVEIQEMAGGREAQGKLSSMGLRPGDQLEIINNSGHGRLILAHDCTRLALGRGVAQKIIVFPSYGEKEVVCE
jgi:Fur family ferric uptake transcriptional regulator